MKFPKGFQEKYEQLLGEEASSFFMSFEKEAVAGFRTNPLKEVQQTFEQSIPSMPWSYYGKVNGKSPEHVSGLLYSQEPAAQVVGQVAAPQEGMKVLDLAAAPGGKSTHLLSYLGNTGLLVSNEISKKRSKILVENIERFGARNVLVTNESAERLAKVFGGYFDMIVLDAPCSGEGMFRKDPAAMDYWTSTYPSECAMLQRDILTDAIKMLAPNGVLIYSTCTWSPEENEEIVQWLIEEHDAILEEVPFINGMVKGIGMPQVARMYPHHFMGEGQFVARLRFSGNSKNQKRKGSRSNLTAEQQQLWKEFSDKHLQTVLTGILQTFGEQLYLLPEELPDLSKLKIARNGLHLGTFKKKRFEPSFALGLALQPREVISKIELTEEQFYRYAAGETINVDPLFPNGWYQVLAAGNGLGFAKVSQGILKNYFPKGLRFR
ncbi:RsmF rRNA methyltransferase first C-terminal domain-containing protein [Streptococcus himalayensis]|uniref:SAM-dependent methyltransferase n=1 Tax=Streptococcus himalayensis TaxID=1888195 RepID=A0A917EFJ8_9STRE|nr:RsmB/NOP family class I SAM-dependent RNA methyltransferase [Streptococcus himalayensis]GGE28131.1 SAM-dependent methyltransferase [Streptococcus himalayensis]